LIGKYLRGDDYCKGLQLQPFLPLENIEPIPKTWIVLAKCVYVN
jgi:hypothetical protein